MNWKQLKKITESNYNLQNKMTVSTKIKQIQIDYLNSTKKITLITKEIKLKDEQIETILEVFSENFKNQIEFVTKNENLNNNLYEIKIKDLNENKNIYYLFGSLLIIIFLIYFISKIYKNYKIKEWKKEENVVKCFKFIKESKKALERKDFSTAKEKYHKLKEIYPLISKDCQKYLYKTIQKIRISKKYTQIYQKNIRKKYIIKFLKKTWIFKNYSSFFSF